MADYDAAFEAQNSFFQEQVDEYIKQLSSKDPAVRRAAAEWLGESAEPKAITKLAQVYNRDDNSGVKQAAKEALGKFRALEQALDRGDDEQVGEIITRIIKGEAPKSSGGSALGRLVPILAVIFVLLAIANVVVLTGVADTLIAQIGATAVPTTPPDPLAVANQTAIAQSNTTVAERSVLIDEVRFILTAARNDTLTLQSQYGSVQSGFEIDCTAFFNNMPPYTMGEASRAAHPDIAAVAERVNGLQTQLGDAKRAYDDACNNNVPLTADAVVAPLATLTALTSILPDIDNAFSAAAAIIIPTVTPLPPTPDLSITPTPQFTATPAPDVRSHVAALYVIIDSNTNATSGVNALLLQYWTDAQTANDTDACRQSPPSIDDNYVLPADVAAFSSELVRAVDQVNLGLTQVRTGWERFTQACTSGTLQADAVAGIQIAQNANDAFVTADGLLQPLR